MNEELKAKLTKAAHWAGWFGSTVEVVELKTALKAIDDLHSAYELDRADGWVSVDKEHPPRGVNVLVYNGFIRNGYLGKGSYNDSVSNNEITGVTHWMPLPNKPNNQ